MTMKEKVEHAIAIGPCTVKDLKRTLGGDRAADRKVMEALDALVRGGIVCQRQGVFFTVRSGRADRVIPCVIVKLGKGFGFARREKGEGDIFIPGHDLLGGMPGDRCLVELSASPRMAGSDEGAVVAITEQHNDFVGTARRIGGSIHFVPDVCTALALEIAPDCDGGARDGEKIAATILLRGMNQVDHRVGVSMRFGSADEAKYCVKALLYEQGISRHFPEDVKKEAAAIEQAGLREEELAGRVDLRALPIFTVDGAETRDIDDAIHLNETAEGFELGVHIADVSHYVRPDSALDAEAFRRGTSIYYADRVVPMLPRQLSNGICSLNPGEARLAFSCLMRLDKAGNLLSYRFVKSVIQSRVKGVYSEVNALLAGTEEPALREKYAAVSAQFAGMRRLCGLRALLRKQRGCMELESGECKLILDDEGHCVDVKRREQGESEGMIEEFMLLANQCAAHFARVKQIPFVYRVHEEPDGERLGRLHTLLQVCGLNDHFKSAVPEPAELAAILEQVRGSRWERAIHTGLLRCMAKAHYEDEPKGHYSLVLPDYAHFTSPIRRYPDLAIHRILTDLLAGASSAALTERYAEYAAESSRQSSEREVAALQLERAAEDRYKAEYACQHLGEHFVGQIAGVTQRGLFVELPSGVEGFVAASSLTDHGTLLTEGLRLSDPLTGKEWSLGDEMAVTIARADVNQGKIDFDAV